MKRAPVLLIAIFATGCGGGGAGTSAPSGGDQAGAFGPFQTRASGGKPQVVTTTTGPVITGIAGAAFTKITYAPTSALVNSRFAFFRGGATSPSDLYIANNDGTNPRVVPGVYPSDNISWSRDGRLALDVYDPITTHDQIYVVNADGTNLHKISSGGFHDFSPAWAPDNFHIAFVRVDASGHSQIYSMTSSGGSVVRLSDGSANCVNPAWTPDSSQVLYLQAGVAENDLWRANANGTSPTVIVNGVPIDSFALSPNASRLVLSLGNGAGDDYMQLYTYPVIASVGVFKIQANAQLLANSWSADGGRILYRKIVAGLSEFDSCTADGNNETLLASFNDSSLTSAAWEPNPLPIPYVSSTGGYVVNNASSGFIYALNGNALASFVNFTATTPSTATLTVEPVMNPSSDVIYHIHADAVTSIKFVNGFGGGLNTITVPAGTKEALVAFNGVDGSVASVLAIASKKNPQVLYKANSR